MVIGLRRVAGFSQMVPEILQDRTEYPLGSCGGAKAGFRIS